MRPAHTLNALPQSTLDAARTLLAGPGALAAWSGPAVVMRGDAAVLDGNDAATPLLETLMQGGDADTARICAAIEADAPVTLVIGGAGRRYEIAVVPLDGGDTGLLLGRDVTFDSSLREALVESRQRYKDMVEISGAFCWETGADGRFAFVSPRGALGWSADDLVGHDPAQFLHDVAQPGPGPFGATGRVTDVDVWFRRREGGLACLLTTALPLIDSDGRWRGARGLCRDVTGTRARDAALARATMRERLLAHVARAVRDEIEPDRMIAAATTATARALAADACRIVALPGDDATVMGEDAGADAAAVAEAARTGHPVCGGDGVRRTLAVAASFRGRPNGALLLVRDGAAEPWSEDDLALAADVAAQIGIALAQIDRERRLEALSRTDALTGLLNRRAFEAELAERLARGGAPGALVYVDLDNFKHVNDGHGHAAGDEVLRAVARLLAGNTRPGDLLARLGGDEFALWLERTDMAAAARRGEELVTSAGALAPYSGDAAHALGFSVGGAVFAPGSNETLAALVARADAAMYSVKQNGKGGFSIAAPAVAAGP
jgi:diguanylate cyclase (GGDEF)-like protein/PAS domain S-box-containing protein